MPARFSIALSRPVLPQLVAAGALAAFALGYLGVLAAPFDVFAQFTAHWLIVAVMAVVASFAVRHAYMILAGGFVFALLLPVSLTQWYALDVATPVAAGTAGSGAAGHVETAIVGQRRFKVLTFNTYNLNRDVGAILGEVRRHDADVVVLIELGPNKVRLRRTLAQQYRYAKTCDHSWDCAIGIFSRLPVRTFNVVDAPDDAGPALISAEVRVGTTYVTVIGAHVLSPNHGPRANFLELDHLAERVAGQSGPVLVVGDLNTTLWANAFDNFRRKSGLRHMGHLIPTWPVKPLPLPQIGIDHIFVSPGLQVARVAAGRAAGSDHLPLIATVELR